MEKVGGGGDGLDEGKERGEDALVGGKAHLGPKGEAFVESINNTRNGGLVRRLDEMAKGETTFPEGGSETMAALGWMDEKARDEHEVV